MNLSPNHTYIFLDFETTGLDIHKDLPIQIALIQTDHHLTVLGHYSSYISLPEDFTTLRSNVSYMTGIDRETITTQGKPIQEIESEILGFFDEKTILIGQNIFFDSGFLKKFFPRLSYHNEIDTYPLAASSIPYLKSYSLETIDQHLYDKDTLYKENKIKFLTEMGKGNSLSAHDALYDCIAGLCFTQRWIRQITNFSAEFPLINQIYHKTQGEGISEILTKKDDKATSSALPLLSSPRASETSEKQTRTVIDRGQQAQHSKRSSAGVAMETLIQQLPQPCIIAVSHGSKIDIIKRLCKNSSFDYLKEEQVFDQEKLKNWCHKEIYSEEEFLFVVFYLAHHRDGYRVMQGNLSTHKHIIDYLQVKTIELKKNKNILCTHGGLYYTIQNNPERSMIYKDYPICIFDADRRHTTYNDYAQKGIGLSSLLYQREKFEYETTQNPAHHHSLTIIKEIITTITFFIAHFEKESEEAFKQIKQYKREINYIKEDIRYHSSMALRKSVQELKERLQTENIVLPKYLSDIMKKINDLMDNPLKIQRNINQNKIVYYTVSAAVRYIDFAEYLRMFGNHKVFFFSPARNEYQKFLENTGTTDIQITKEENLEKTLHNISNTRGSVFVISHNADRSKKLFGLLHSSKFGETHTLVGEYLTGGVGKNASRKEEDKPSIIIGGYHMLLHFWGEGKKIDHIIISYIPQNMNKFIEHDIKQYAIT